MPETETGVSGMFCDRHGWPVFDLTVENTQFGSGSAEVACRLREDAREYRYHTCLAA